jgi:N-methylhydantoinase A/oxoprolinase/acetone carboxylase beta subunit
MELDSENTVDEIIESAATFWSKDMGAYVVRKGKKVLRGNTALVDAGVREDDTLELIPDPEGG